MGIEDLSFEEWLNQVPESIRTERFWQLIAYQKALYLFGLIRPFAPGGVIGEHFDEDAADDGPGLETPLLAIGRDKPIRERHARRRLVRVAPEGLDEGLEVGALGPSGQHGSGREVAKLNFAGQQRLHGSRAAADVN